MDKNAKKERLELIFSELKKRGIIRRQKDLALLIKTSEANVSHALKGDERFLTNKFLLRINNATDNIFRVAWLLTGEGEMLEKSPGEPPSVETSPPTSASPPTDADWRQSPIERSSNIDALLFALAESHKLITAMLKEKQTDSDYLKKNQDRLMLLFEGYVHDSNARLIALRDFMDIGMKRLEKSYKDNTKTIIDKCATFSFEENPLIRVCHTGTDENGDEVLKLVEEQSGNQHTKDTDRKD